MRKNSSEAPCNLLVLLTVGEQFLSDAVSPPGAVTVSLAGSMPFFLFPRVKSEAIVARREPKEEVEDVSSYLCTELVYYITKMPAGKGGLYAHTVIIDVRFLRCTLICLS